MFLFKGDSQTHETVIRNVKYITTSYYDGEKDIFEKIGDLIVNSFCSSEVDELTNESSLDSDMDIEDD